MKLLTLLLSFALLAPAAEAKPRWKDWRWWAVTGVTVGSTVFQVRAQTNCRAKNDVAVCYGGYGSPKAMDGLVIGMSGGFYAISNWSKSEGFKEWALPTLGMSTFNFVSGIKQTQANKPKGDN